MECVICGKNISGLVKVELDGAIVEVCSECQKFGSRTIRQPSYQITKRAIKIPNAETQLVESYGYKIKQAREKMGMKRFQLAHNINEKESLIRRVEEQRMEPDDALVKKIEMALKIDLTEEYEG